MTIRILLSKVVGKRLTKIEDGVHFQCSGKTKNENGIPMAWVNEKRNWKFEFRFPTS